MNFDFEDYIKQLEADGYIDKDGMPLKCRCEHSDFEVFNEYRGEHGVEEYELKCNNCNKIVGHWVYGCWQV